MGGLPVPSIAITKTDVGFTSFGNISLVAEKSMIDPDRYGVQTFNSDIYSPRYPAINYEIDSRKFSDTFKKANDLSSKYDFPELYPGSTDIEYRGAKELYYNTTAMLQYLIEKGNAPRPKLKDADIPKELHKYIKNGFVNELELQKNEDFIKDVTAYINRTIEIGRAHV